MFVNAHNFSKMAMKGKWSKSRLKHGNFRRALYRQWLEKWINDPKHPPKSATAIVVRKNVPPSRAKDKSAPVFRTNLLQHFRRCLHGQCEMLTLAERKNKSCKYRGVPLVSH